MVEEWKDIEGYEGKYQVSNTGKVRSMNYNNTGKIIELKQKINRYGYCEVKLSKDNKGKDFLVSTLVGKHFLPQRGADMQIMHKGNILDNSVENLKYGYNSEIKHLMYKNNKRSVGTASEYKISYKGVQYRKRSDLAKKYNISNRLLSHRIDRGWTLEEALEIPKEREEYKLKKQLYLYNDKLMTLKQLSILSGISEKTISKRLKRGWSVIEAVEIPLAKNNH